jgi:uncharacterized protein
MDKTKLQSMLVRELKALAKKMKIDVPAGTIKNEIVKALLKASGVTKSGFTKRKTTEAAPEKKTRTAAKKANPAAMKKMTDVKPAAGHGGRTSAKPAKRSVAVREWKLPPGAEEPLMAQERVSGAKYYTGPSSPAQVPAHGELPLGYGTDKVVIMSRDPFVAYAYWEATPERIEREKAWFGWSSKLCLRIYDITGVQFDGRNAIGYFDQEIFDRVGNWYFDFGRPNHSFCADVGLLTPEGRFLTLARSNYITMPRDGVSEELDEEWMLADEEFWKLYGYPETVRGGSSPQMQERELSRRRRLRELEITSPGLFSGERQKRKQKP